LVARGFNELKTGEEEDGPGGETGWMRDQSGQGRVDPTEVPNHSHHEVLDSGALGTRKIPGERFEQRVDPLSPIQPACDEVGGGWPGGLRAKVGSAG
jgi:hypothetical protein